MDTPISITDLSAEQWRALNSATQYPSIPTYHCLGERGRLTEERNVTFDADVEVTEKIDGTNTRIVVPHPSFGRPVIGSRTELLHYLGDLIANPAQGIVETVRDIALRMEFNLRAAHETLMVVFGEVFGGRASSGSKNYSTTGTTGFRIFDIAIVSLDLLDWDIERVAGWRDNGGQMFLHTDQLTDFAEPFGYDLVPRVAGDPPPSGIAETAAWLTAVIEKTHVALDDSGQGRPEGVVVRTPDRSRIAKIRFEDYQRTLQGRR